MTERDLPYLQHVLDACADITEFVARGRADAEKSKLVLFTLEHAEFAGHSRVPTSG